jgi:hypothetical protein
LVTWQEFVVIVQGMFFGIILPPKNTGQRGLFVFQDALTLFSVIWDMVAQKKEKKSARLLHPLIGAFLVLFPPSVPALGHFLSWGCLCVVSDTKRPPLQMKKQKDFF